LGFLKIVPNYIMGPDLKIWTLDAAKMSKSRFTGVSIGSGFSYSYCELNFFLLMDSVKFQRHIIFIYII
jgi:hypothetical protein